jgi:predicted nucleotidyltransferase
MDSRVQSYINEVTRLRINGATSLVSLILFGSAASGVFSQSSDVDLIIVIPEDTSPEDMRQLRAEVTKGLPQNNIYYLTHFVKCSMHDCCCRTTGRHLVP